MPAVTSTTSLSPLGASPAGGAPNPRRLVTTTAAPGAVLEARPNTPSLAAVTGPSRTRRGHLALLAIRSSSGRSYVGVIAVRRDLHARDIPLLRCLAR